MAFISSSIYNKPVSADVVGAGTPSMFIRAKCGDGYVGLSLAEARDLRDDLSRAITEAATAAAKAVQTEGAAA